MISKISRTGTKSQRHSSTPGKQVGAQVTSQGFRETVHGAATRRDHHHLDAFMAVETGWPGESPGFPDAAVARSQMADIGKGHRPFQTENIAGSVFPHAPHPFDIVAAAAGKELSNSFNQGMGFGQFGEAFHHQVARQTGALAIGHPDIVAATRQTAAVAAVAEPNNGKALFAQAHVT